MKTKKFTIFIIATCLLCLTMVGAAFANEKKSKENHHVTGKRDSQRHGHQKRDLPGSV